MKIVAPFGVHGALRVISFADDLSAYAKVFSSDGIPHKIWILKQKVLKKSDNEFVISIENVRDRTAAERLKGALFFVEKSDLSVPEEDEFYHCDLIGSTVRVLESDIMCNVVSVANYGAGDLLELSCGEKTFLVPFTHENFPSNPSTDDELIITKETFEAYV